MNYENEIQELNKKSTSMDKEIQDLIDSSIETSEKMTNFLEDFKKMEKTVTDELSKIVPPSDIRKMIENISKSVAEIPIKEVAIANYDKETIVDEVKKPLIKLIKSEMERDSNIKTQASSNMSNLKSIMVNVFINIIITLSIIFGLSYFGIFSLNTSALKSTTVYDINKKINPNNQEGTSEVKCLNKETNKTSTITLKNKYTWKDYEFVGTSYGYENNKFKCEIK